MRQQSGALRRDPLEGRALGRHPLRSGNARAPASGWRGRHQRSARRTARSPARSRSAPARDRTGPPARSRPDPRGPRWRRCRPADGPARAPSRREGAGGPVAGRDTEAGARRKRGPPQAQRTPAAGRRGRRRGRTGRRAVAASLRPLAASCLELRIVDARGRAPEGRRPRETLTSVVIASVGVSPSFDSIALASRLASASCPGANIATVLARLAPALSIAPVLYPAALTTSLSTSAARPGTSVPFSTATLGLASPPRRWRLPSSPPSTPKPLVSAPAATTAISGDGEDVAPVDRKASLELRQAGGHRSRHPRPGRAQPSRRPPPRASAPRPPPPRPRPRCGTPRRTPAPPRPPPGRARVRARPTHAGDGGPVPAGRGGRPGPPAPRKRRCRERARSTR